MSRIAYVNGRFLPIGSPAVPVEDRGYQFADGVYEVIKASHGQPIDLEAHFTRLDGSLRALGIPWPMSRAALALLLQEVLRRNGLRIASLYLQISRGIAARNHAYEIGLRPSLVVTARTARFPTLAEREQGVGVITAPDERWARCEIKSISLLPNVLAKQRAASAGCREVWLVDAAGQVTEGGSSNAYIVDFEGQVVTRPLGPEILGGVTRRALLELAARDGIQVSQRAFSVAEAKSAREAFLTSTTSLVLPVVEIDGQPVANGQPGSITRRLAELYDRAIGFAGDRANAVNSVDAGVNGHDS